MKVSYKGMSQELSPKIRKKLEAKFAKLSKLLDKRGEHQAHVVVTSERHLHNVEITIQFYDHQLIGEGAGADLSTALTAAFEKVESQAVKNRGKWREKQRRTDAPAERKATAAERKATPDVKKPKLVGVVASSNDNGDAQRIFRVNHKGTRKPMTLDEAVLEMENNQDYLVYRDADKDRLSLLVRRRDGHFDLIES
jgi:putative sigma-54 modulation protein